MSYDVYVEYMGGDCSFNYTSNLGPFFAWALDTLDARPWGIRWLGNDHHGRPVAEAMPYLRSALERIDSADRAELKKRFDAPNGWGSVEGATRFMREIYQACLDYPDGRIRVSA